MNETQISLHESLSDADKQFIHQSLHAFNIAHAGPLGYRTLAVLSRQESQIVGGLIGDTHWNWLFIKTLWVADAFRRRGLGRSLMLAAEQEAFKRGCSHAYCDTFDFQALPFYQKLGYEIFGQLDDFPTGHHRYFLQKRNLRVSADA